MTKQERIREQIALMVKADRKCRNRVTSEQFAAQILQYLGENGLVIKVDRDLPRAEGGHKTVEDMMRSPDYKYCGFGDICDDVQQDMLKAGYCAVEPLIEVQEPIAEPEPEQSPKCTACEGKGFIEYEHGLIQVECEVCKGTELAAEITEQVATEAPETQRSPNQGEFFCSKCNSIHRETSRIGKKHLKYNDNRSDSRTESANQSA